jgi:hypothetical protein
MKYLKRFNESGIADKDKYYAEIESYISDIKPNIKPKEEGGKERNFKVGVSANNSKYGKQVEVNLALDTNVDFSDVSSKIKSIGFINKIKKIISDSEDGKVTFVGFKFFGENVMGAKDGKLVTIKDVSTEFKKQLEELKKESKTRVISFWFNIKK